MKLIDISHTLHSATPVYPGDPPLTLTQTRTVTRDGYCAWQLETGLHAGTHVDVPMHLLAGDRRTIADFPLETFTGPGVLLDVRGERSIGMKPAYTSLIGAGSVVLLWTGWDLCYDDSAVYFSEHPAVSRELGEFLIARNIRMLGMDMPSPDYPPFPMHKALLAGGIPILENLAHLDTLASVGHFTVMAFPLRVTAEASLVRALCGVG